MTFTTKLRNILTLRFTDREYDVLKKLAQYVLPAAGTLYFTLAEIWGLPYAEEVVKTIIAFDTFLGVVLGVSTMQYNKINGASEIGSDSSDEPAINEEE